MKTTEIIARIAGKTDDKARRVLNIAPRTVANVTAEQIENGLTLEELQACGVPVLCYQTQVTLHGVIPEFGAGSRDATGYANLFRNGNGSLGVRYAGIDAGKKRALREACRLMPRREGVKWEASIDSKGTQVCAFFTVRDEANRAAQKAATLECLKSVPVSLFYGGAGAGCLAYGMGYFVEVSIGAIPVENVDAVLSFFSGAENAKQVATAQAEEAERVKRERAEREAEQELKAAELERKLATAKEKFAALLANHKGVRLAKLPEGACDFCYVAAPNPLRPYGAAFRIKVAKRGFGFCYSANGGSTWHRIDAAKRAKWEAAATEGRMFAAGTVFNEVAKAA